MKKTVAQRAPPKTRRRQALREPPGKAPGGAGRSPPRTDNHRTSADVDQTSSNSDQSASDADQTASATDQASADRDQVAADLDQTTADHDRAAHLDLSAAEERAYVTSRDERESTSVERQGNRLERASTARERDVTAGHRDRVADARDETAGAREARGARASARRASARTTVLEASPNPIVAIDVQGGIVYVNPKVESTFGYEPAELLGKPVEVLLPERVRERHVGHRDGFKTHPIARPMGIGLDLAGRRKDGSEFPVEISLSPVETDDELQVFATIVDIAARKAAESRLLQVERLESIGRLAGGIAHDFNNMLFAIHGYCEILDEDLAAIGRAPFEPERLRRSVQAITDAAQRAADLTAQLLAFSRQQVVTVKVLDLNVAVTAIEPMLDQLIGANLQLILKLGRTAGHIRADAGQIGQIVANLVVNARDAMPDGGTVTIETANVVLGEPTAMEDQDGSPGRYVLLAVRDTGVGMDRSEREHIFEPFYTTKGVGKGTGLGLATTYGIVRQAGGHIRVDSVPGSGSAFKLYFPRVDEAVEKEEPPVPPTPVVGVGTVLVVEDEPAVRDMTMQLLERAGYDVVAVAGGTEAIARTDLLQSIDVLVTDVIMPIMSGIELAELMMDRYPRIGVVLLSGYTAETLDLERVTGRGATFVRKPISSHRLIQAVHEALASSRSAAVRRPAARAARRASRPRPVSSRPG